MNGHYRLHSSALHAYKCIWHLRIWASSLQFRASKINMALARMDKLVKKLMSNPAYFYSQFEQFRVQKIYQYTKQSHILLSLWHFHFWKQSNQGKNTTRQAICLVPGCCGMPCIFLCRSLLDVNFSRKESGFYNSYQLPLVGKHFLLANKSMLLVRLIKI
jgi:hypothetical protein